MRICRKPNVKSKQTDPLVLAVTTRIQRQCEARLFLWGSEAFPGERRFWCLSLNILGTFKRALHPNALPECGAADILVPSPFLLPSKFTRSVDFFLHITLLVTLVSAQRSYNRIHSLIHTSSDNCDKPSSTSDLEPFHSHFSPAFWWGTACHSAWMTDYQPDWRWVAESWKGTVTSSGVKSILEFYWHSQFLGGPCGSRQLPRRSLFSAGKGSWAFADLGPFSHHGFK